MVRRPRSPVETRTRVASICKKRPEARSTVAWRPTSAGALGRYAACVKLVRGPDVDGGVCLVRNHAEASPSSAGR